jgi:hypothetical protein
VQRAWLATALCIWACDTSVSPRASSEADAGLSPTCLEAEDHSDLAWIQREVFTPSCASFNACHVGAATTAGGLNLEPGESEAAVVGVPSASFEDWLLVEPGLPESSYLLVILGGAPGPVDPSVGLMPLRAPALCRPMVDAVGRWIAELGPRE